MTTLTDIPSVTSRHGGKAVGLRRLLEAGVPVPPAVALDATAVTALLSGEPADISQLAEWLRLGTSRLAVRSSASDEDGNDRSFAGIFETVLEVERDLPAVLDAVRRVTESGRSERAIAYSGSSVSEIPVVIQQLIEPVCSGVLFSKAVDVDGDDIAYVEWVEGFGDKLVDGRGRPSSILIPIANDLANLGGDVVRSRGQTPPTKLIPELIRFLRMLPTSMENGWDAEWALDPSGQFWALQLRPITIPILMPASLFDSAALGASPGQARGPVCLVNDENHHALQAGDVLVARITEIGYLPAMQRAAAIVTEEGGLVSHAASVARELGKPCVVGAKGALKILVQGLEAEVDGTVGTVKQHGVDLGNGKADIDWASVYLYDRGIEMRIAEVPAYVEETPDGLFVYVDEETPTDSLRKVEIEIRRRYRRAPRVRTGDRRIWHREWRRYYQLRAVCAVESEFTSALASWQPELVARAISKYWKVASLLAATANETSLSSIYSGELGCALHSLASVVTEGHGVWLAYRDSAAWRLSRGATFAQFLTATPDDLTAPLLRIRECLRALSEMRNTAYNFFSERRLFTGDYFSERAARVEAVCLALDIPFESEDQALDSLYADQRFRSLNDQTLADLAPVLVGND